MTLDLSKYKSRWQRAFNQIALLGLLNLCFFFVISYLGFGLFDGKINTKNFMFAMIGRHIA